MIELYSYLNWITDEQIKSAQFFKEWCRDYTSTPNWSITNLEKNAYHIKYLAEVMIENGWVGPPAIYDNNSGHKIIDGNHRIRAIQYIKTQYGIDIEIKIYYV